MMRDTRTQGMEYSYRRYGERTETVDNSAFEAEKERRIREHQRRIEREEKRQKSA